MDDVAIKVDQVSKTFRLPHEKTNSIKGIVVNFWRRKRTFETQTVLHDVSFEIKKGEFFGIVGRNGSGKSTLLKMIAGIYSPSAGGIKVNGTLTPFIELGVGFNPELTGRENVFLNGSLLGFGRKEVEAMYNDIVNFAELSKFMDQKLKNYSSGMQVRLAFSIAIRARSDILLLDEVLAVGDAAFQQKCYDYFIELKEQKKTVIFVSHDMANVTRFCSQAVYLKDGQLLKAGSAADIADLYTVENIQPMEAEPAAEAEAGEPDKTVTTPKSATITSKIIKQEPEKVVLRFDYTSRSKDDAMYVGISLLRDGISIGEITTPHEKPLRGKGSVTYTLDTSILNGGAYEIGSGLFKLKNKELLAAVTNKSKFAIKDDDITRGASLKLNEGWDISGGKPQAS